MVFVLAVRQHILCARCDEGMSIAAVVVSALTILISPCVSPPHNGCSDSMVHQLDVLFHDTLDEDDNGAADDTRTQAEAAMLPQPEDDALTSELQAT